MPKVGIVRHSIYLEHDPGPYHPESPERLRAIYSMIDQEKLLQTLGLVEIDARKAAREEIEWIHDPRYIDLVASTAKRTYVSLDPDTSTSPESYEAALMAAGGLLEAVKAVHDGTVDRAFALVRPPGHHAERDRGMGFCLFNNVAIAAEYALKRLGAKRVAIADWDLHHGNATQHSFYERSDVLYLSTHQFPYYPGSGAAHEVGTGEGEGFTVNVPLSTGHGDGDYMRIFEELFKPIILEYRPDMILLSAGFDIYERDPLGGMSVTPQGFGQLTRILLEIAEETCNGRLVATLEGGYDLTGLALGVKSVLEMMAEEPDRREAMDARPLNPSIDDTVRRIKDIHRDYWKSLT
ncbi:MAG TPA: histone deacetylase [Proteobacteria bacterium]|nr:histone deacetylase [Pseudomonadota bacterium]